MIVSRELFSSHHQDSYTRDIRLKELETNYNIDLPWFIDPIVLLLYSFQSPGC